MVTVYSDGTETISPSAESTIITLSEGGSLVLADNTKTYVVYASRSGNTIDAQDHTGTDAFFGGNGKDIIYAGTGNAYLSGNNGSDFLIGNKNSGSSVTVEFVGGNGGDVMMGGGSRD